MRQDLGQIKVLTEKREIFTAQLSLYQIYNMAPPASAVVQVGEFPGVLLISWSTTFAHIQSHFLHLCIVPWLVQAGDPPGCLWAGAAASPGSAAAAVLSLAHYSPHKDAISCSAHKHHSLAGLSGAFFPTPRKHYVAIKMSQDAACTSFGMLFRFPSTHPHCLQFYLVGDSVSVSGSAHWQLLWPGRRPAWATLLSPAAGSRLCISVCKPQRRTVP